MIANECIWCKWTKWNATKYHTSDRLRCFLCISKTLRTCSLSCVLRTHLHFVLWSWMSSNGPFWSIKSSSLWDLISCLFWDILKLSSIFFVFLASRPQSLFCTLFKWLSRPIDVANLRPQLSHFLKIKFEELQTYRRNKMGISKANMCF